MITRGFPTIISTGLVASKKWYIDLLGWDTEFDSDWFVHLKATGSPGVELGILDANHAIVPRAADAGSGGPLLTFVVDNVDTVHGVAVDLGYEIIETPTDLFYGQRRMVLVDADGTIIDVSSECEPSQDFLDSLPHLSEH